MKYDEVVEAIFVSRLNRFIAEVDIKGVRHQVHVRNTGRCMELFIKGAKVYLEPAKNPDRKTKYSLVALYKDEMLINIDSQIPNYVAKEAIYNNKYLAESLGEVTFLKSEVTYGNSRFDLYYENNHLGTKGFIEVKGVTLEENQVAKFPDAPTTRGTKHINELIKSQQDGYKSYILFVVQLAPVNYFMPNDVTDPDFGEALRRAKDKGVTILCFDSVIKPDSIVLRKPIEVRL
jgi:sugar fermentation stimulation protein A